MFPWLVQRENKLVAGSGSESFYLALLCWMYFCIRHGLASLIYVFITSWPKARHIHSLLDFWATSSGMLLSDFQWNTFERLPVEYFWATSSGMLLSEFQWNVFERLPVECFWATSSGMLLSDFQWNPFERLPVECFWATSSGMLLSDFQWNAFKRIPTNAFERIPVECF